MAGRITLATLMVLACFLKTMGAAPNDTGRCRDRQDYWSQEEFRLRTCADCYWYLFGRTHIHVRPSSINLIVLNGTGTIVDYLRPDVHDPTLSARVCDTLELQDQCDRWRQCCEAAEACCQHQLAAGPPEAVHGSQASCPMTWDGYACWDKTTPGQEVDQSCPTFIPHAMPSVHAYKKCTDNASWYSIDKMEWTNYTTCLELQHYKTEVYISLAANIASIVLLVPALTIFFFYRSLRKQHRIRLHIQLFLSFLLDAIVNILWETMVVYDRLTSPSTQTRMHQNTVGCKLLYVLTRYTGTGNYLWMFFEGFYLHRLIVKAFQPPRSLMPFYLLGWGFPWLPVSIYAGLKATYADESCWIKNYGILEWLIYIPNLLSLVANLFFLADILRILLTQLQSHPNEPSNYRWNTPIVNGNRIIACVDLELDQAPGCKLRLDVGLVPMQLLLYMMFFKPLTCEQAIALSIRASTRFLAATWRRNDLPLRLLHQSLLWLNYSDQLRALKATFILIPLFGLQMFAIIYRPAPTAPGAKQYEMVAAFITNSQGFFVALIFCFLNGEVLTHLKSCFANCKIPSVKPARLRNQSTMQTQVTECCASFQNKHFLLPSQTSANQKTPSEKDSLTRSNGQTYIAMTQVTDA